MLLLLTLLLLLQDMFLVGVLARRHIYQKMTFGIDVANSFVHASEMVIDKMKKSPFTPSRYNNNNNNHNNNNHNNNNNNNVPNS